MQALSVAARWAFLTFLLGLIPMFSSAQTMNEGPELDSSKDYYAVIVTNLGTMKLKLFPESAPITVRNFVNLAEGTREFKDAKTGQVVKRPYFNGVIFHRCIAGFMIQGGDPTGTGRGGPGYQFQNEYKAGVEFDAPGKLAMANAGPNTNGSQFFITEEVTHLKANQYTVFGELVDKEAGLEVVKKAAREPQNAQNRPNKDIVMERVVIVRAEKGTPVEKVDLSGGVSEKKEAPKGS